MTRTDHIHAAETTRDERSFSEEIEHDKQALTDILSRPQSMLQQKGVNSVNALSDEDKKEYELEKNTADTIKRTLQFAETAGVQLTTGDGQSIDASENGLPNASYFMHGARFKFELPEGSGHDVANYILNGATGQDAHDRKPQSLEGGHVSKTIDSGKAQGRGNHVFTRVIATHGASFGEDGSVTETKGPAEGVKAMTSQGGKHFGMNVAAGAYGETDIHDRDMSLNGLAGHLYVCYIPPTETSKGCMLIGMEGCVPPTIGQVVKGQAPEGQFDSHDVSGSADNFTTHGSRPAGERGGKLGPLDARLESEKMVYGQHDEQHPYQDTVIPRRYDGMGVPLTNDIIAQVTALSADDIASDIGNNIPKSTDQSVEKEVVQHQSKQDSVDKEVLNAHCPEIEKIQAELKEVQNTIDKATEKAQKSAEKAASAAEKASEKGGWLNKRKAKSAAKKAGKAANKAADVASEMHDTITELSDKLEEEKSSVDLSAKHGGVFEEISLDDKPSMAASISRDANEDRRFREENEHSVISRDTSTLTEPTESISVYPSSGSDLSELNVNDAGLSNVEVEASWKESAEEKDKSTDKGGKEDRRQDHATRKEVGADVILTPKQRQGLLTRIANKLFGSRQNEDLREALGGKDSILPEEQRDALQGAQQMAQNSGVSVDAKGADKGTSVAPDKGMSNEKSASKQEVQL